MSILRLSKLRPLEPGDYTFVLSTFAHSYKGSKYAGTCPANEWHSQAKMIIDGLLARKAKAMILVNSEDDDQFLGWILFEQASSGVPVVHYVYVKDTFRFDEKEPGSGGLAKYMLQVATNNEPFFYTHRTREAHPNRGAFSPDLARRKNLDPVRPR